MEELEENTAGPVCKALESKHSGFNTIFTQNSTTVPGGDELPWTILTLRGLVVSGPLSSQASSAEASAVTRGC